MTAMLLIAASCQTEIAPEDQFQTESATVTLTARLESEATKTYVDGDDYVCWADGDKVWINGAEYTVSVSGSTATISGVTEATDYACVYPSTIVTSFTDGHNVKLALPADQTITFDSEGRQRLTLPMAAYGDGSSTLEFKNLCALLAVEVSNTDKSDGLTPTQIKVSTSDGDADMTASLYGETYIPRDLSSDDYDNDWAILASNIGNASSTAKMSLNIDVINPPLVAKGSSRVYYITVPVINDGTRSKISIEMTGTVGSVGNDFLFSKKTTSSVKTIGRSQMGAIPVSSALCYEIKTSGTDWNGSGTAADPWQISCLDHWNKMAAMAREDQMTSSHHFLQVCDIDCGGEDLYLAGVYGYEYASSSLATDDLVDKPFVGVYDGGGHTISNFNITYKTIESITGNSGYNSSLAPFPSLTGTVKNLTINGTFRVPNSGLKMLGGVVGYAQSSAVLTNLEFNGTLITGDKAGSSFNSLGGIAAEVSEDVTVSDLTFSGKIQVISSSSYYCGGVIGKCSAKTIDSCHNAAGSSVEMTANFRTSSGSYYGGVFGYVDSPTSISNCSFEGSITSSNFGYSVYDSYVGGVCGLLENFPYNRASNIVNTSGASISFTTDDTSFNGSFSVGGLFGKVSGDFGINSSFENNASISFRSGNTLQVGGIAGCIDRSSTWPVPFDGYSNNGTITATSNNNDCYAGGFAGKVEDGGFNVMFFKNNSTISATAKDDVYAGGVFGYVDMENGSSSITEMTDNSNKATVTATSSNGDAYAGGFAGFAATEGYSFKYFTNSAAVKAISSNGDALAGGFAGKADSDGYSSKNFKNTASVSAVGTDEVYAGGLIGWAVLDGSDSLTINGDENCGDITAKSSGDNSYGGGFFGYLDHTEHLYFENCTNNNPVYVESNSEKAFAGGMTGYVLGESVITRINKFRNFGTITADNSQYTYAAGVVGYDYDQPLLAGAAVQIFNSENRGAIISASGNDAAGGGFLGYHDSDGDKYYPCIINCCNRGDIKVNGSDDGEVYIGGMIGYCYSYSMSSADYTEIGCSYSRANLISQYYDDLYCGGLIGEGSYYENGSYWCVLQTVSGAQEVYSSRHDGGTDPTTTSCVSELNLKRSSVPYYTDKFTDVPIPSLLEWKQDSDGYPALSF